MFWFMGANEKIKIETISQLIYTTKHENNQRNRSLSLQQLGLYLSICDGDISSFRRGKCLRKMVYTFIVSWIYIVAFYDSHAGLLGFAKVDYNFRGLFGLNMDVGIFMDFDECSETFCKKLKSARSTRFARLARSTRLA